MASSKHLWPSRIYVSSDSREDPLTLRVLKRLSSAEVVEFSTDGDPNSESNRGSEEEVSAFSRSKRQLMLTRYRGTWLKSCPGTSQHVCCNLWIVNPGEGCPFDCTYCYLQSYLRRNPTLKLYTNVSEMLSAIESRVQSDPNRLFRVGTGELVDSLVWDDLTDFSHEIVPFFGRFQNAVLELKTKSANVANLVELKNEHRGNTVVSWSLNAASVNQNDEKATATIPERLAAAAQVVEAGYRIGLHFDPLIHFQGWEDEYRDLIQQVFSEINPSRVAWVSVSSLRYRRDMERTMRQRFPDSQLPYGEQFLARDDKVRYIQPLRFKLINFVWNEIRNTAGNIPLYMCMESSAAWRTMTGGAPAGGSELVEIFSRKNTRGGRDVAHAQ